MKPIKAGKLKHRITFQRDAGTPDVIGGNVPNWVDVMTVWASMVPQNSREFLYGAQVAADTTLMFKIRWRTGLHSAMRVTFQGRTYYLTGPPQNTEGENRELIITLKEPETTT